jgi:hypothetical protein
MENGSLLVAQAAFAGLLEDLKKADDSAGVLGVSDVRSRDAGER